MKKLILILIMFFGLHTFAQQDFTYKIKVLYVNNIEEAKAITDPIRFKFKAFPVFNDSTDTFEFNSNVNITKQDLTLLLAQHGYLLGDIKKSERAQKIEESNEIKEQ